jgi:hypothetical protein
MFLFVDGKSPILNGRLQSQLRHRELVTVLETGTVLALVPVLDAGRDGAAAAPHPPRPFEHDREDLSRSRTVFGKIEYARKERAIALWMMRVVHA